MSNSSKVIPDGVSYVRFFCLNTTIYNNDIAINYPSTVTTYSPYSNIAPITGHTAANVYDEAEYDPTAEAKLNITFPDAAGTVYGGTLTINEDGSGSLVVDREIVKASTVTWDSITNAGKLYFCFTKAYVKTDGYRNFLCTRFKTNVSQYLNPPPDVTITNAYSRGKNINVRYDAITSLNDWNTYVSNNDFDMVFYMEPTTYTLTAEQVGGILTTLKGENNWWADTGDVSLEYRADTKLYLEKLTAPTEDDLIADHAIASGTFFMIGNQLFKATAAIANGANITIGTNATQLSLADALNLINA